MTGLHTFQDGGGDDTIEFLGWASLDKKKTALQNLTEALRRFQEKHGHPANTALVNVEDYAALMLVPVLPENLRILARTNVAKGVTLVGYDSKRKKGPDLVTARN